MRSKLRHKLLSKINLWGIGISVILVLTLITTDIYNRIRYVNYVSLNIDLMWKLDNRKIGSITIEQKIIFKIDSNNVLKQLRKKIKLGNQEIIVYDKFGEVLVKDTVSIGFYNLYNLTILEINKGADKVINVDMTEVLLE